MNTTISAILVVFLLCLSLLGGMASIHLVGFKKWWVWLFVMGGFISGLLIGLIGADVSVGFALGTICVIMIIFVGTFTRWQRQYYSNKAEAWMSLYEHDSRFSLLTRLIKRFTGKQNVK
jgi:hypothetical protein